MKTGLREAGATWDRWGRRVVGSTGVAHVATAGDHWIDGVAWATKDLIQGPADGFGAVSKGHRPRPATLAIFSGINVPRVQPERPMGFMVVESAKLVGFKTI